MDATRDWDVLGHQHTDAFAHPSPFAAADVLDPSLFPNQSQVQGDRYTDTFILPSLPPQPFAATDVLDPSLFPNQSQVQGDRYTDAFSCPTLPPQPFIAADVLDPSLFPNQSQAQGDWHTDAFIRPSLPPQPFAAADVLDPSLFPNQSQVQGDWHTDAFIRPSLLSQSFVDHPSFQSSVNGGHNFLHPCSNPRDLAHHALSNLTQGDATNASIQAVPPFQTFDFDQNQEHLATDVFAHSISATSDLTATAATSLEWIDETKPKRAVRIRADDKEDQGGKCHPWANLREQAPETHDALRWAEACAEIHVVRDIFPSRRLQDVDLILDAGIELYALENGERIELAISRPDSRRTVLSAASHSRTNDKDALETQIVLRPMGFLKDWRAKKDQRANKVLEANLSNMLHWFGINFDFIDFTSINQEYSRAVLLITKRICKRNHIFAHLLRILGHIPICVYKYTAVLLVYLMKYLSQEERRELCDGAFQEMTDVLNRFKNISCEQFLGHSRMLFIELGARANSMQVFPALAPEFNRLLASWSMY